MQKDEKEYSYMLRFRKDLPLDSQALGKIEEFCSLTRMNKKDAIILLLATANVPAIIEALKAVTVQPQLLPGEKVEADKTEKVEVLHHVEHTPRKLNNITAYIEKQPEEVRPQKVKAEQMNQEPDETGTQKETVRLFSEADNSLLDDIFNNF